QGGKRGPTSGTRDHFWPPVATNINGEHRWSFRCRHCPTCVTVKRTVEKTDLFGDEKPAPALGNLATHYKRNHADEPVPSDVKPGETRSISASSAKIMGDFLIEGKLNPAINSTQGNFLKIFAAWIIEDDLPFTTGETPGIERLVRNALAKMYIDMYDLIKSELAAIDKWVLERPELRPLFLKPEDWALLKDLNGILEFFTNVTLQMSRSGTPTLPWVLPMYEGMLVHLRTCRDNETLTSSLRDAAAAGLEKLEGYYSKA
ncbi:hypothetical protein B0H13DRAFT_1582110, partial [Mycena leptocephala]